MSGKLSFKDYLSSKETLRKAVEDTPKTVVEYEVEKYCNLPILGETQKIKLKPKNKLFVRWMCEDKENPTAMDIEFEGTDEDGVKQKTTWNDKKLLKWLINNTKQSS